MTGLLVDLGPRLAWASAGAGVLALLAWVVGAALPRTPAAMRALLWWLAALRLLAGLIPLPAVALPVLPAPAAGATAGVADVPGPPVAAHVARAPVPARAAPRELGRMAAIGAGLLWLAGTLVSFARMTGNWRSVRRILADAAPVLDPVALGGVGTLARRAGLRHPPRLLSSGEVATPFAAGLLRPAIVLPGRCAANTSASRLALAHEISHVRGHDLLWAWVPALSRCVLWFHPLAHLAEREFARAREEAADAAALRLTGAARDEYARVLLSFGIARGPSPALAAPGASRHFRQLKRRIEMLQNIRHMSRRQLAGWAVALVLLAAAVFVPVRLVAAQSDAPKPMPSRDALPAAPPAPPAIPAPAVAPPPLPPAPAPAPAPAPLRAGDDAYVIIDGEERITFGSSADARAAERLAGKYGPRFIWARRGDERYVIQDDRLVRQLLEQVEASTELAKEQGELGAEQGGLGERQADIGRRMGQVGVRQAELAVEQARQAVVEARRALREQSGEAAEAGEPERERTEEEMRRIEAMHAELAARMEALSREMEPLAAEQERLAKRQEEFARQQEKQIRETERVLQREIDDAIASGKAEKLP